MLHQLEEAVKGLPAPVQAEAPGLEIDPNADGPRGGLNTDGKEAVDLLAVPDKKRPTGLCLELVVSLVDGHRPPVEATVLQPGARLRDDPEVRMRAERTEVRSGIGGRNMAGSGQHGPGLALLVLEVDRTTVQGLKVKERQSDVGGICIICYLAVRYHPTD